MSFLNKLKLKRKEVGDLLISKKEKLTQLLKIDSDFKKSYRKELHRLAKEYILIPIILIITFEWLFFIHLDKEILSEISNNKFQLLPILILRYGLTAVGVISLLLYSIRHIREKYSYYLLIGIVVYFELTAAIIAGTVAANHAYMSGFLMVLAVIPIVPLERRHSLIICSVTLLVFCFFGFINDMHFTSPEDKYVLFNIFSTILVVIAATFVLDIFRRRNFEYSSSLEKAANRVMEQNTELEKVNQEQNIINQELQEANEIKDKVLSMAAHDLKDPLQVIILYAKNITDLKDKIPAAPWLNQIDKAADKISANAEKMEDLIKQTLETALIDNGKIRLNKNHFDFGDLAEFVVKTCIPLAEKKKQEIHFQTEKGCIVKGDNVRLGQIMENLLCNAVKFSEKGKSIWVTVECSEKTITFKVRDEGPGLSEEDKKNLFKEFHPLTPKPTGGETSTGLGLSIASTLVKLHGGDIRVESEPGKGSTFIVELPV